MTHSTASPTGNRLCMCSSTCCNPINQVGSEYTLSKEIAVLVKPTSSPTLVGASVPNLDVKQYKLALPNQGSPVFALLWPHWKVHFKSVCLSKASSYTVTSETNTTVALTD